MAYTIRYGPVKTKRHWSNFLWTCFFFLLFLIVTNVCFSEQLELLREILFPQATQTIWKDMLEGVGGDAH